MDSKRSDTGRTQYCSRSKATTYTRCGKRRQWKTWYLPYYGRCQWCKRLYLATIWAFKFSFLFTALVITTRYVRQLWVSSHLLPFGEYQQTLRRRRRHTDWKP